YDAVREAESPDQTLIEFLQSTYEAAAKFGNWNQKELQQLTFKSQLHS
ncbi:hypothetical protein H6F93_01455, partial [Leptolyngbya sp. FACHB-671]|nr:hypothetical protein [Leptolyngbya sp. FACHB-671]